MVDQKTLLANLRDEGLSVCDSSGRPTKTAKLGGRARRVLVLSIAKIREKGIELFIDGSEEGDGDDAEQGNVARPGPGPRPGPRAVSPERTKLN